MRLWLVLMWAALAVALLWPLLRQWSLPARSRRTARPTFDELVKDPVCQTYVVRSRALPRVVDGVQRHFCSEQCARRFTGRSTG